MFKKLSVSLFLPMMFLSAVFAQQKEIPLYPNGIPNSKPTPVNYVEKTDTAQNYWITDVSIPTITPYLPEKGKATGTAIIVFPGGGYSGLASNHEGRAVAQEFNKVGVTAFVVKYRLPSDLIMVDKSIGPLQDAQRAIQLVREHAAEWGIDPHKVGIIGFSAGGHLASTLDTHYQKALIDNPKNISLRPDFAMLIYPVISFGPEAHVGSRENLIGKNPSQQLLDLYSNEKQITSDTPPTFLVHATDDDVVPVQNSILFYNGLIQNKVKAELHIFEEGGHGFGLENPKSPEHWFDWAASWIRGNGF
ncbi:MAG TPA: alpha/beta hydrolase [Mucilaginibacter sp.]|jgi:acetyl esterase/lipase|nr:alpha/beta hydrolase [Mucilaginibacter sp.]